ncbi:Rha family transcriptional regulator [Acuticoccus sp. M5D2P5]|uniref:Rha family transcriptional regulator n=1 Tax=Acuticoccus kalidii TaxID=2910977 RepID=UPI001F41FAB9|nr:Rha family transcriptional regulator [Acuticoccus kalidii]MCF3934312.1 Rha family transcriptional regulator [Acuticoccus kalidii]
MAVADPIKSSVTMSSLEIAEQTGKRHDNVMRDIRSILVELHGEADALTFEGIYLDAYGREKPCYQLPERELMILLTGYSIPLRAKVIDRWKELEEAANNSERSKLNLDRSSGSGSLSVAESLQIVREAKDVGGAQAAKEAWLALDNLPKIPSFANASEPEAARRYPQIGGHPLKAGQGVTTTRLRHPIRFPDVPSFVASVIRDAGGIARSDLMAKTGNYLRKDDLDVAIDRLSSDGVVIATAEPPVGMIGRARTVYHWKGGR